MKKLLILLLLAAVALWIAGCPFAASEPPPVTHATGGDYSDCAGCHADGLNGAPKTDHPRKADCLSCHPAPQGS